MFCQGLTLFHPLSLFAFEERWSALWRRYPSASGAEALGRDYPACKACSFRYL